MPGILRTRHLVWQTIWLPVINVWRYLATPEMLNNDNDKSTFKISPYHYIKAGLMKWHNFLIFECDMIHLKYRKGSPDSCHSLWYESALSIVAMIVEYI